MFSKRHLNKSRCNKIQIVVSDVITMWLYAVVPIIYQLKPLRSLDRLYRFKIRRYVLNLKTKWSTAGKLKLFQYANLVNTHIEFQKYVCIVAFVFKYKWP